MTAEFVLVLSLFAAFIMGALVTGPTSAFREAGPKLGARIEKQMATGEGFLVDGRGKQAWEN
jgi:hypothetical protein